MPRAPRAATKCTRLLCSKRTERSPKEKRCVQRKALFGPKSSPEDATESTACCPTPALPSSAARPESVKQAAAKGTPRRTQRRNDRAKTWRLLAAEPVARRTAAAIPEHPSLGEKGESSLHPLKSPATSRIELVGCRDRWGRDKIKQGRRWAVTNE